MPAKFDRSTYILYRLMTDMEMETTSLMEHLNKITSTPALSTLQKYRPQGDELSFLNGVKQQMKKYHDDHQSSPGAPLTGPKDLPLTRPPVRLAPTPPNVVGPSEIKAPVLSLAHLAMTPPVLSPAPLATTPPVERDWPLIVVPESKASATVRPSSTVAPVVRKIKK